VAELDKPRLNTLDADLQAYQEQRTLFFQAQALFKAGNISAGILCCGYLHAMYGILPAVRYTHIDKDKSLEFINGIDDLRKSITQYQRQKEPPKTGSWLEYSDYEERLGNKLDALFIRFLEIMFETGLSK
jgi:hypothetical protein